MNVRRHIEATAVFYNCCTLDFGYFDHAAVFLSSMPPMMLGYTRSIHISGYKWPPVLGNTLLLNTPPPDAVDAYCTTWDKLCDILRGLGHLRDLRISLNNGEYSKEREAELIDDLKGVRAWGTIVLQLPPTMEPENCDEEGSKTPLAPKTGGAMSETWHEGEAEFRLDRRGRALGDRYCNYDTPEFYLRGQITKAWPRERKPFWKKWLIAPICICAHY
jgi:hypothetical protein